MSSARWNVLLYAISGTDSEHSSNLAAIAEMHGALTTDDCQIVMQVHAPGRTTRYWLSAGHPVRTQVLPQVVDASRQSSLTSFLDEANRTIPAASTMLVLWAHAAGLDHVHSYPKQPPDGHPAGAKLGGRRQAALIAHSAALGYEVLRGGDVKLPPLSARSMIELPAARHPDRYGCQWGPDPNSKDFLTNVSMKQAIAASARGRVDVLALNACHMAALEIAYELRKVADVEVASQVYARPWPYGAIIAALSQSPVQTAEHLARLIVSAVHADIVAGKRDDAVSAIRAGDSLEQLADALDPYAKRVTALIDSNWQAVQHAVMNQATRLDDPYQLDLLSLIRVLGKGDPDAEAAAKVIATRLDAAVIANAADAGHPGVHGLSLFCPRDTHVDLIDAYQGTDFRTHAWAKFLCKFQRRAASS
ncbi:MAG TPA: clostripain-related cysteine peptidase [Kofleriaceae bacterium]|jgi:hypothetical protein|nr:clostripain-related cysteine peptidase [Kofleriaceae bacterium]